MSSQLPNGLWSDFQPFEDARVKANANFNQLDWSQWKCVIAQLADAGDLPGSPSVGDSYLVSDTQIYVWYNLQWNIFTPPCGFIFYDQTLNEFFFNVGGLTQTLANFFSLSDMTPVGVIHIFDDYGILTLPAKYVWCDGSTIANASSPLDGLVATDLSGMAIVGYGTIGAGDIDTVAYDATPVGNASNQINIAHTHTVASHTHTLAHTHNIAHTHTEGTLIARIMGYLTGGNFVVWDAASSASWTDTNAIGISGSATAPADSHSTGTQIDGTTSAASTSTSGGASTTTTSGAALTTDSSLSATQNIQPRSLKKRFILKILP